MLENILHRRTCLGKDGVPITIYKIRTMYLDAESELKEAESAGYDEFGHIRGDSRVTPIGRPLRKYWLDETPQLAYNVPIKKNMKLVGVRPANHEEWQRYPEDLKEEALKQKPGLIGFQYGARYIGKNFNDHIENMRKYLKSCQVNALRTDIEYFTRFIFNILFRKVKSC